MAACTTESQELKEENEEDEPDSHPLGNPAPPPDVDLEMLRGDRIGDTVYSGKWCIQTVMKLLQSNAVIKGVSPEDSTDPTEDKAEVVNMDEDLQNEVGVLWDMTSNEDVCEYLHSVGAVESICYVISNSCCPRATEMSVGMLANIITHEKMWEALRNDATMYNSLIPLLANVDQPSLLEVIRFFNTALCQKDHSMCYSCLCQWKDLLTQELARILSGSAHGDLLKQTVELVYNLLCLDEDDTCYCAFFADADFILALVEASREIGYEQVTSGQNFMMLVLYQFTTFQAGALAIESCLEQIAYANTSYLKYLCHNLSLSNDSDTITTILVTLNHIFCRHRGILHGLASSSSFVHSILKVLVTVYRRLGLYSTITYPKDAHGSSSLVDGTGEEQTNWTEMDDTPNRVSTADAGSWSERGIAAAAVGTSNFRTPNASPLSEHRSEEPDVSWSERRVGTPLHEHYQEEVWKRPKQRKRLAARKVEAPTKDDDNDDDDNVVEGVSGRLGSMEENSTASEEGIKYGDNNKVIERSTCEVLNGQEEVSAMRIAYNNRFENEGNRKSGGFSPTEDPEKNGKRKEHEISDNHGETRMMVAVSTDEANTLKGGEDVHEDCGQGARNSPEVEANTVESSSYMVKDHIVDVMGEKTRSMKFDSSDDEGDDDLKNNFDQCDAECGNGFEVKDDKYHKLLRALREFLTDLFNNCGETRNSDDERSSISDMVSYLDRRCSSTEIRALVKCVGNKMDASPPVRSLVELCQQFKAKRLKRVISSFLERNPE